MGGTKNITGSWRDDRKPVQTTHIDSSSLRESVVSRGDDALSVGLDVEWTETTTRKEYVHSVTVAKRKWLSIGLFPGAAETAYAPKNGLHNLEPVVSPNILMFLGFYVMPPLSVVAWPLEPAECSSHYWEGPNAECLLRLSPAERAKIGARIQGDGLPPLNTNAIAYTHRHVAGCMKYCTYVVSDPVVSESILDRKQSERRVGIEGPFDAELSIPELSWTASGSVEKGQYRTEVVLPFAFPPGTYEAELRLRFPRERLAAEKTVPVRRALEAANGKTRTIRFTISP